MTLKTSEAQSQIRDIQSVVYSVSGSIVGVDTDTTGSADVGILDGAFRLHRIQVLCSQSADPTVYEVSLYDAPFSQVTGSDLQFNAWSGIAKYINITGSCDYSAGLDQLEDRIIVIPRSGSNISLSIIPKVGSGSFAYRLWCEYATKLV